MSAIAYALLGDAANDVEAKIDNDELDPPSPRLRRGRQAIQFFFSSLKLNPVFCSS
jgi:hypothetical protein